MAESKYRRGRKIETISDFDSCESLWYKWDDKTVHRSFLITFQYRTLLNAIISGRIYVAERKEEN